MTSQTIIDPPEDGHFRNGQASNGASPTTLSIHLTINGRDHALDIEPRVTLLDALRERLHLTGTKKGCDQGQCGACTVHVDAWRRPEYRRCRRSGRRLPASRHS